MFLSSKYLQKNGVFCLVCLRMIANSTESLEKKNQPSLPSCLQIPVTFWEDQETTEIEEQFPYIDAYNERFKKMMKHK